MPESWGMRSAERRKLNVLQMKCFRSLVGVSRMDRFSNVRNEGASESWNRNGVSGYSRSESIKMAWACGKNG